MTRRQARSQATSVRGETVGYARVSTGHQDLAP